jgi:uncharacterized protein DUF3631
MLDKHVAARRGPQQAPPLYPHWDVMPSDGPVDTDGLLRDLTSEIKRYVATLGKRAIVPALWTMGTYVHEAATHSPLLLATSPEPDSGKSTMLGVIGFLARRSLLSVSISGPALFRSIAKWQPTFIVDEADTALATNTDLKEVVNSGWTRGQGVIRCDAETNDPILFSTFAPKAIGMKGKRLPDTTLSRAIVIEMKRKQPDEVVADFNHQDNQRFHALRRKLVRWAADHAADLSGATPMMPDGFHNRTRANWWLPLAIAELAGADAAVEAREAAASIERGNRIDAARASIGIQLLADLKALFDAESQDRLLSRVIVERLTDDPERPWAEYKRGKPLTQKQLANVLGGYRIWSVEVHPAEGKHGKGYRRDQFVEAWDRYLSSLSGQQGSDPRNRANADDSTVSEPFSSARDRGSARMENADLSYAQNDLRGCADRHPPEGVRADKAPFRYRPNIEARIARALRAHASKRREGAR